MFRRPSEYIFTHPPEINEKPSFITVPNVVAERARLELDSLRSSRRLLEELMDNNPLLTIGPKESHHVR